MKADHTQVTRLLKTARGQIDGILKMVEEDRYCLEVSSQIMAAQSILKKANRMVLKAHMDCCVREAVASGAPDEKLEELAALLEEAAARKGRHAEEPFPGRGKQRIGSGVPRFRLLAVCCRSVTFIHDVDLELHAFLKAAARRRERGRPRVQDQYRRKTAPQPGPCILVRLSLKRR